MTGRRLAAELRRRAPNTTRQALLRLALRPRTPEPLVRLGSEYGGWWVPRSILRPGAVAYCAGAGEDITFDLELHKAGCKVAVFDPTPRAIAFVREHAPHDVRFGFFPVGWWSSETELRFFAPADSAHVSHSVVNLQGTRDYFVAPVRPVVDLMTELGDTEVDLIKMDIEGAEGEVIRSLLADGPLPRVLCVEFDQPQPLRQIIATTAELGARGLLLAKIEDWNLTFIRV